MIKGSIKNMTTVDWREYYADHFYQMFADFKVLRDASKRRELSSAEEAQKRVIEEIIDRKLA